MSLHTERLIIKGKLEELKQDKMRLATRLDANIKAARQALATSLITPLAEIDLVSANVNLSEAVEQQREYLALCEKIQQLEKELA